jgi:hypothetical protein
VGEKPVDVVIIYITTSTCLYSALMPKMVPSPLLVASFVGSNCHIETNRKGCGHVHVVTSSIQYQHMQIICIMSVSGKVVSYRQHCCWPH